ncbi:hypothetical protein M8494_18055 [Serratia ureilytica]
MLVTLATCFGRLGLFPTSTTPVVTRIWELSVADGLALDGADHPARPERLSLHPGCVVAGGVVLAY